MISIRTKIVLAILPLTVLAACASTPEPEKTIEVTPDPIIQDCYPLATLEKVVVPAVTETRYAITSVESPPDYYTDPDTGETVQIQNPPIRREEPYTITITPEKIYYKTSEGKITADICELNQQENVTTDGMPAEEQGM